MVRPGLREEGRRVGWGVEGRRGDSEEERRRRGMSPSVSLSLDDSFFLCRRCVGDLSKGEKKS
jgi:hypothetical protein